MGGGLIRSALATGIRGLEKKRGAKTRQTSRKREERMFLMAADTFDIYARYCLREMEDVRKRCCFFMFGLRMRFIMMIKR